MWTWIVNIFKGKNNQPESVQVIQVDQNGNTTHNLTEIKNVVVDPNKIILDDSRKRLANLKVYKNFFDTKIVDDIYNQSEIIHKVFESNKELSYKKLEQYHYYYTDNLLELFVKLKKSIDENVSLLKTQIKIIDNKIDTTKKHNIDVVSGDLKNYENMKYKYASYASLQLSSIYNCLIDKFNDFRFVHTDRYVYFNRSIREDLFWIISSDLFIKINELNETNSYKWEGYTVERKLLGKLQKNLFIISFEGVLYTGSKTSQVELFKIKETGEYFIYNPHTNVYKFVDYDMVKNYCVEQNTKYNYDLKSLEELKQTKFELNSKLSDIVQLSFKDKVKNVLNQYLLKIEDVDLIEHLTNIDIETENLRTMIELERLEI